MNIAKEWRRKWGLTKEGVIMEGVIMWA